MAAEKKPWQPRETRKKGKPRFLSRFTQPSAPRGQTGRGKKNHFHFLDRYIRRIDALVPEDMEHLVRPLSYKPNQEKTTKSLKITLGNGTMGAEAAAKVTEDDVRDFLAPDEPLHIAIGWEGHNGEAEVYVHFRTNAECVSARQRDGAPLNGEPAKVRYSVDEKWRRVCKELGIYTACSEEAAWSEEEGQTAPAVLLGDPC